MHHSELFFMVKHVTFTTSRNFLSLHNDTNHVVIQLDEHKEVNEINVHFFLDKNTPG